MGLSKSRRMQILLTVSFAFFLLELGVGVWVHSLALVADSFHMFNDVLSLCVGIWAVNVAQSKSNSKMYTYGWQRAETLGALINGVFLVALCCSIFLEAIQRFVDVPEVKNPKWILGVGSAGLLMNILGLFLFHDHSHSHGEEEPDAKRRQHNHEHASEEGLSHGVDVDTIADERGNVADVLPENRIRTSPDVAQAKNAKSVNISPRKGQIVSFQADGSSPAGDPTSPRARRYSSKRRSRGYSTLSSDIAVHPASLRNNVIAAGRLQDPSSDDESDTEETAVHSTDNLHSIAQSHESTPLLKKSNSATAKNQNHSDHHHAKPKTNGHGGGHGHGHGHGHDLNMRAVFLHVLGDALGNIGVIATALFIWLTPYKWRFYADPVISLVITCIILYSALPLCRAASRILLQAVPLGLNVDEIKADILSLRGIVGVHHLHVWQLSDTKLVASLHVRVSFDFKGEGSAEYMELARQIRSCLHGYGIHSSTIQPEFFCKDIDGRNDGNGKSSAVHTHEHEDGGDSSCSHEDTSSEGTRRRDKFDGSNAACLLDCDDECGDGGKCCGDPAPVT